MNIKMFVLIGLCLLTTIVRASPNAEMIGKVIATDRRVVEFATVQLKGTNIGAITNLEGNFQLIAPPGNYLFCVSAIGYETFEQSILLEAGEVKNIDVIMSDRSEHLNEVVVLGKNDLRKLKEEGFSVNVLDMKKMELQSIRTDDLLDRMAGVRIRQSGGLGSSTNYNINGLSGSSVRVFIDGIPIRNYGSSFSLASIPAAQIERVEVFKGVVPAHLSEDALGGAINIVLKESKAIRKRLSASYSYGSFNTHQGSVDGSYRNIKTGFTVDGSIFYNYTDNNYKVWGDQVYVSQPPTWQLEYIKATRFHDAYESYGATANIGFTNVKWADRFSLGLLYSDMNKDVQNAGTMEVVFGNRRTGQDTKMANLRYEKRNVLIQNLDIKAFASYTQSNRWVVDTIPYIYNWTGGMIWDESANDYYKWSRTGEQGAATLAVNKEKTIAGRANVSYKIHHQHRISANYLYNNFIRDVEDPLLPAAEQELTETRYLTKQIIGLTYENNFFNERLRTSLFGKYYIQHVKLSDPVKQNNILTSVEYDETVSNTGYGLTASFALMPRILMQTSYEKALRLPESNELLGNTSESVEATYDLKPEKSQNLNLGLVLGPFNLRKHEFRADFNFFIRDISDMIIRSTENSRTGTYGYENLGKVNSKGFDAEFGYNYKQRLLISYNVSLFNARYKLQYDTNGKEYVYYNDRLRNAPYFTMNTNVEYVLHNLIQKRSRTSITYNYGYVHAFFKNWESIGGAGKAVIPTQNVHDLGLSYAFPKNKLTLSFNARNIFDAQVFDNWALQKPGRAFYGKIIYRII